MAIERRSWRELILGELQRFSEIAAEHGVNNPQPILSNPRAERSRDMLLIAITAVEDADRRGAKRAGLDQLHEAVSGLANPGEERLNIEAIRRYERLLQGHVERQRRAAESRAMSARPSARPPMRMGPAVRRRGAPPRR